MRGPQRWQGEAAEREAVYANRRRKKSVRGQRLMRQRGEMIFPRKSGHDLRCVEGPFISFGRFVVQR
jgi:hypothetical protein